MSVLVVASSEPGVGRSLIAAALAYRFGRDGRIVSLARLDGDGSAAADAATFSALPYVVAAASVVTLADVASMGSDAIVEAPAGALPEIDDAKVLVVGGPTTPSLTAARDRHVGTIVTNVRASDVSAVSQREGVIAVIAEDRVLAAPSSADIASALQGRWLAQSDEQQSIDRVMIGTVASDAASPYFGARERKCVITRYDKTDIQLAALLTDVELMVLTGGGQPSPYLIDRISNSHQDVSVLLAEPHTVDVMRSVEGLYGCSRFEGTGKLMRAVELLDAAGVDIAL